MTSEGKLELIWRKPAHGQPMETLARARLVAGGGMEGNADQGGRRQITLIEREVWEDRTRELAGPVDPIARRANLLVSGVSLVETKGRVLRVGSCRLRIQGETKPCGLMDEAHPGLRDALGPGWGGGAYAEVLEGGDLEPGVRVVWEEEG
jgi:MOSC domain-containing protein YiiM